MAGNDEARLRALVTNFQNQQLESDQSSEEDSFYRDPETMFRAMGAGQPGGLPMPKLTTAADVRRRTKLYVSEIFDCLSFVRKVLERHEETIYKRWSKKTRNQRCRLLMAAWPNMVVAHRPDFAALRAETDAQRAAGTRFRDSYLLPYINMDDLSRPRVLPLLLHTRGHNQPSEFAFSDLEACHVGIILRAITPEFLNEHIMMFSGRNSASTYGELTSWDDNPDAFQWMHERIAPQPGEGLLTLEIQSRLYNFLKECCKLIMHDIPEDKLGSDEYVVQPKFQPPSENDIEGFQSLEILAMEAPYRRPMSLDWMRIKTLLFAKKTAAEDHIWSLREDPGYFSDAVLEYREHRQELILDSKGQIHPVFRYQQTDTFWGRVLGNIITNAYISLEVWHEIATQAERLIQLESKHRNDIKQTTTLPNEYLSAILTFEHYLKQSAKGHFSRLKDSVVASPAFRPFFERTPPPDAQTPMIRIKSKTGRRAEKAVEQLKWLLQTLWEDDQNLFLLRLTNVVDELQRHIQSEPKASEAISTYIAEVIGDLSITCECLRQVQTYYPWAANFENALVDHEEYIKKQFARQTAPWGSLLASLKSVERISRLGNPEDGKFRYPIDKRRTKDNVNQLRDAESNLDSFWSEIDRITSKAHGFSELATGKLLRQAKILKRTPEWIEPMKNAGQGSKGSVDVDLPLSALYFDVGKPRFDAPKLKDKKKTRGTPSKAKELSAEHADRTEDDRQPIFEVDNRAAKVFRTIFYTPSPTATPGEVPWTDFVHAMVSTGFSAEKLYGSAWQFSPSNLDVDRSIQFHEPHPASKLPYRIARRFGRRLNKAYGWHGQMFVQKT